MLTDAQIKTRLDMIERMIGKATAKELPGLNATFQRLIDELVRREMARTDEFGQFVKDVEGIALPVLRCDDAPPTEKVLELMDKYGEKYESFVLRHQNNH